MISRYSLNPQPVDKIGEYCERLPIGEVTYLQDLHNVNLLDAEDNGETYLNTDPEVYEYTEVDIETFFFPEEIR